MRERFGVRPVPDGDGVFGVWDCAVNGWRGKDLTEAAARQLAADLEVQYTAYGPRPADDVRRVEAAKPVEFVATWQTGELDVWVRDGGQWVGRVRDREGRFSWVPAGEVRPIAPDQPPT